jgi:hypothetical protein
MSGMDLRIRAIKELFSDDESPYLWTSSLKGPSGVNMVCRVLTIYVYIPILTAKLP